MSSHKVLIADTLAPAAVDIFRRRGLEVDEKTGLAHRDLLEVIGRYDALVVRSQTRPDASVIAAAQRLKVIGRAGVGVDNIDIAAATARGIVVMNAPRGNAVTTAEHTIALMFAAARSIPDASAMTKAGKWPKKQFMGTELTGKTFGLIGCGNVGAIVAERAIGLKMTVCAYDPYLTPEHAASLCVEKCELDQLLARADVISVHTPLTAQTRNILSEQSLALTRKGVIIINCARGGLVDEEALRDALVAGHVGAAACDVFSDEPAHHNVLFDAPRVVATPHLGASTVEAQDKVAVQIAEQMSDYLLTGAVSSALNTPSVSAQDARRLKPYIFLAEHLGLFAGQIAEKGLTRVEVEYEGDMVELNRDPLTATALTGLLRPALHEVNMVSAPAILKQRGGRLTVACREQSPIYDGLVRIRIHTSDNQHSVAGTLVAGHPCVVEVNGMTLDARFSRYMLLVVNRDEPGFIGFLGGLLGEAQINIATFHLGRTKAGGNAIALLGVDQPISKNILDTLRDSPQVRDARFLTF